MSLKQPIQMEEVEAMGMQLQLVVVAEVVILFSKQTEKSIILIIIQLRMNKIVRIMVIYNGIANCSLEGL